MTPAEIQLIVSIATITGSGVISVIIAHKLAAGRAEREFRRKKLEEVFMATHRFCITLFTANFIWTKVMAEEIDYNQGLEFFIKNHSGKDNSHHDVAVMLINIYFPELRSLFNSILDRRNRINSLHRDFTEAYKQNLDCISFLQPFQDELKGIDEDEKKFADKLFKISESLR
jgi:hypothetical protein